MIDLDTLRREWLVPLSKTPVMEFLDETDFFTLLVVAFVANFVTDRFCRKADHRLWARRLATVIFGLYFLYRFIVFAGGDPAEVFWSFCRSFIVGWIALGLFQTITPIVPYLTTRPYRWARFKKMILDKKRAERREREAQEREQERQRRVLATRPHYSPAEYRSIAVHDAQRDYEHEVSLIDACHLDDTEKRRVLLVARQKLLARIHGAFQ